MIIGKNIVLYYMLGISPLILYKTSIKESLSIGFILTIIMIICSSVSILVNNFILIPLNLNYLQIVFILVINYFIIYYAKFLLHRFSSNLAVLFENYPDFFYTNYAVYGLIFLSINLKSSLLPVVIFSFGSGIGYLIVIIIFMALKERLMFEYNSSKFKNIYLELIALGLFGLVFFSIAGLR